MIFLGVYEAEINGEPVDDTYFHPGWTNYRKRLQYQTYQTPKLHFKNSISPIVLKTLALLQNI